MRSPERAATRSTDQGVCRLDGYPRPPAQEHSAARSGALLDDDGGVILCRTCVSGRGAGEPGWGHVSTCAVIVIDTRTFGISTPSFATALVGGTLVKTVACSSFMPAKSPGLARSTVT